MKKTNKYIKYIKRFSIMIVTLLLSFTLLTGKTYALSTYDRMGFGEVRYTDIIDNFQGNPNLFAMKLEVEYLYTPTVYWTTDFQQAMLQTNEDDKYDYFTYIVRSSTLYIYQDGQPQRFINDVYNIMWVKNLEGVSGNLLFMSLSGAYLASYDVEEMGVLEMYLIQDRTGTYEPYWEGYYDGRDYGYDLGYDDGFDDGFDDGYDSGYDNGTSVSESEAYDQGYIKGSNDSFMASIKDWIVPAIIIVLFLGGALTIIAKKREG